MSAGQKVNGYKPGDKATNFTLKNVDGKMVSLADYKDVRGFIIIFTCNHCPYARGYEDRIIALHQKFAPKGFPVVAINPNESSVEDDSFTQMQKRVKDKKIPYAYLADDSQQVSKIYGATKTPHVFLLEKQGEDLIVKYTGGIDDNSSDASLVTKKYLETAIEEVLAGKSVTSSQTRAIGCSIKWKNS